MKKIIKWAVIVGGGIFLLIQVYRPERTNPPEDPTRTIYAQQHVSPEVKSILERSCKDCHSYRSEWPWYSYFAPGSWIVTADVKTARGLMNFSDWKFKDLRAVAKLDQMCEFVQNGTMPLPQFALMHPRARLTKQDIDAICDWVEKERDRLMSGGDQDTTVVH